LLLTWIKAAALALAERGGGTQRGPTAAPGEAYGLPGFADGSQI
jgi:hypothetical protein